LLGEGRASLDHTSLGGVPPGRAGDAPVVDAAVLREAAILDGDDGFRHPGADTAERNGLAVPLGRDRAEQRSVRRVDEGVLTDLDRAQRRQRAARAEGREGAEAEKDERQRNADERGHEDHDGVPLPAAPAAGAQSPAAAAGRKVAGRRLRPSPHCRTPAARNRRCARSRSSRWIRSASVGSSARVRIVTVALSARSLTKTSGSRSSMHSARSRSMTVSRSELKGTCTVTSARWALVTIVELRMVSEASLSFGITKRVSSSARMNVNV